MAFRLSEEREFTHFLGAVVVGGCGGVAEEGRERASSYALFSHLSSHPPPLTALGLCWKEPRHLQTGLGSPGVGHSKLYGQESSVNPDSCCPSPCRPVALPCRPTIPSQEEATPGGLCPSFLGPSLKLCSGISASLLPAPGLSEL